MSRRSQLEYEVSQAKERLRNFPKDVPGNIKKIWEQELRNLELELNNLTDEEEDNND
mgnify:FL=1|jgi:hypothetical protein